MPLIKTEEIRDMSDEEMRDKLKEMRDELFHDQGQAAMGGAPESPGRIRALKRNIARILTVMNENKKAKGGN
ncbi:MAG: 50S ribosomal protein L29 [Thermoplasmata archaeon]